MNNNNNVPFSDNRFLIEGEGQPELLQSLRSQISGTEGLYFTLEYIPFGPSFELNTEAQRQGLESWERRQFLRGARLAELCQRVLSDPLVCPSWPECAYIDGFSLFPHGLNALVREGAGWHPVGLVRIRVYPTYRPTYRILEQR